MEALGLIGLVGIAMMHAVVVIETQLGTPSFAVGYALGAILNLVVAAMLASQR